MKSLLKNIILVIMFIAIAVIGYYLFVIEKDSSLNTDNSAAVSQVDLESKDFLQKLKDLEGIQLSNEILKSPVLQVLRDFSTPTEQVSVGRENPFGTVE